jgi:hypothetical protein
MASLQLSTTFFCDLQWLIILEMILFALIVNRHFPVEEFRKEKDALLEDKRKSGSRRTSVSASAFV